MTIPDLEGAPVWEPHPRVHAIGLRVLDPREAFEVVLADMTLYGSADDVVTYNPIVRYISVKPRASVEASYRRPGARVRTDVGEVSDAATH